jgi:hypothetical protein
MKEAMKVESARTKYALFLRWQSALGIWKKTWNLFHRFPYRNTEKEWYREREGGEKEKEKQRRNTSIVGYWGIGGAVSKGAGGVKGWGYHFFQPGRKKICSFTEFVCTFGSSDGAENTPKSLKQAI